MRNSLTLDIGVFGYIDVNYPKERSHEMIYRSRNTLYIQCVPSWRYSCTLRQHYVTTSRYSLLRTIINETFG